MLSDVIESALRITFRFFIEIICFYTGEIVLPVLTIGKKDRGGIIMLELHHQNSWY